MVDFDENSRERIVRKYTELRRFGSGIELKGKGFHVFGKKMESADLIKSEIDLPGLVEQTAIGLSQPD